MTPSVLALHILKPLEYMTKKKEKVQAIPCPDYTHSLPKELADLLHQKPDTRYTKFEAFRYLMEQQALQMKEKSADTIQPFIVTVTQLASLWNWHRHTVTVFLDDLMVLGIITKEKIYDGFKLCFTAFDVKMSA